MTIILPIPDHKISPNGSRGRTKASVFAKARRVKRHRRMAEVVARAAIGEHYHRQGLQVPTFAGYSIAHFFKTTQFRDDDNADAACKAYRDGIADALGTDDHKLPKLKLSTFAKDAKNPRVEITLYTEAL